MAQGNWQTGPGGLSVADYMGKHLKYMDGQHYSAAGIIPYRKVDGKVEILCAWEKPWNAITGAYDTHSWSLLGGKRTLRVERTAEATAVRSFLEIASVNGELAKGAPSEEALYKWMADGCAMWYGKGKYAILLCDVGDAFPEAFLTAYKEAKEGAGPPPEFVINDAGIKRYVKQIKHIAWVKAAALSPECTEDCSNLITNLLKVDQFKTLLAGELNPAEAFAGEEEPKPPPDSFKGQGKGYQGGGGGGWGRGGGYKGGKDKGKGKASKGGKWGTKGGGGGMPYMPMEMWAQMGQQMPPPPQFWNQPKGKGGKGKGGMKGMPMMMPQMMMMPGQMPGQMPQFEQSTGEVNQQLYGEQLYSQIKPMAPSAFLAQKITGMLLELPTNELQLSLNNTDELGKRVHEAMELLKEDGVTG